MRIERVQTAFTRFHKFKDQQEFTPKKRKKKSNSPNTKRKSPPRDRLELSQEFETEHS
ncbi:hypothetical protein GGQ84_000760 [Desulfitispora alkaliphila]|uniref:hypothetical protein n=1 Tax=Desulfitispora alkaliphila TaxID=622674 RepID=UPI003D20718A